MTSVWRVRAAPIIAAVLAENAGASESELRKALRSAYPFGERQYHPYKIWLDEVNRQRGREPRRGLRRRGGVDVRQGHLFGGAS